MSPSRHNKPALPAPARWRTGLVCLMLFVTGAALAGRGLYLQVLDNAFLTKQGRQQHTSTVTVEAHRGAIVDRNGKPLALSAPTVTVWSVPAAVLSAKPATLDALAEQLGVATSELINNLQVHRNSQFYYLERQLPPFEADKIRALDAPGVFFKRVYKRFYPFGPAAAQVAGLTDIDGNGIAGIELATDKMLSGTDGERRVVTDLFGHVVNVLDEFDPPEPGEKVRLTIDARLQTIAFQALRQAVREHHAANGSVVVLDPETGQLLALASVPSFNPNDRSTITPAALRMRPALDVIEPGSSIKGLLASGALDKNTWPLHKTIETRGWWYLGPKLTIHDSHDYGTEDLARILKKSSNIGAAHIGLDMGAKRLWNTYREFGLGRKTGAHFPGESDGTLRPYTQWNRVETATAAYGYGVGVTPLQLTRAYGAIANNGVLPSLQLIMGQAGRMHIPPHRIISRQTAMTVRRLLTRVVEPGGTAEMAALDKYTVAGKTGTARLIVNGQHTETAHRAIFVGMAPAANPQLVILVEVKRPTKGSYFGGTVAAPVFKKVMRQALRMLHIPPSPLKLVSNGQKTIKVMG